MTVTDFVVRYSRSTWLQMILRELTLPPIMQKNQIVIVHPNLSNVSPLTFVGQECIASVRSNFQCFHREHNKVVVTTAQYQLYGTVRNATDEYLNTVELYSLFSHCIDDVSSLLHLFILFIC